MWPPSTRSASFSSCRMDIRPTNSPSATAHRCVRGTNVSVVRLESANFPATNAAKSRSTASRSTPRCHGRPSCRKPRSPRRKLLRYVSEGGTSWTLIRFAHSPSSGDSRRQRPREAVKPVLHGTSHAWKERLRRDGQLMLRPTATEGALRPRARAWRMHTPPGRWPRKRASREPETSPHRASSGARADSWTGIGW